MDCSELVEEDGATRLPMVESGEKDVQPDETLPRWEITRLSTSRPGAFAMEHNLPLLLILRLFF